MIKNYFLILCLFTLHFAFAQDANIFDVARKGTVEQATALFKSNPKVINTLNEDGYSPLILACYRANNDVAKFFIDKGADINYDSGMGTALMAATVKGNIEISKILIDKKANVNLADSNKMTALIYASTFKNYEIASLLVKAGADINAKDSRGNSALDYAILADDDKLIQILKSK